MEKEKTVIQLNILTDEVEKEYYKIFKDEIKKFSDLLEEYKVLYENEEIDCCFEDYLIKEKFYFEKHEFLVFTI